MPSRILLFLLVFNLAMALICSACQGTYKSVHGLSVHRRKCKAVASTTQNLIENMDIAEGKRKAIKIASVRATAILRTSLRFLAGIQS